MANTAIMDAAAAAGDAAIAAAERWVAADARLHELEWGGEAVSAPGAMEAAVREEAAAWRAWEETGDPWMAAAAARTAPEDDGPWPWVDPDLPA